VWWYWWLYRNVGAEKEANSDMGDFSVLSGSFGASMQGSSALPFHQFMMISLELT